MAGTRIEAVVEMMGIYSFERMAYTHGTELCYIYNMQGEDGTVYVWKTTSVMGIELPAADPKHANFYNKKGEPVDFARISKGDKVVIIGTVKGLSEYKGQPQTVLTRVRVKERVFRAETWEERQERIKAEKAARAQEQVDSLSGEDFIWRMPYKQYKEHYSDCETVEGSYSEGRVCGKRWIYVVPTIEVIIREGRLKNSGVRGQRYSGYRLVNQDGEQIVYRAVKEENAIRRAEKEFGGEWTCIKVYEYEREEW